MIEKNICLLLGAGASAHLGFPLGAGLKNSILRELDTMRKSDLGDYPEAIREQNLDKFHQMLLMGDWSSPDAFLEDHEEFLETGKFLICKQLAEKEDSSNFVDNMGWYQNLISAIRTDDDHDIDKLKKNNLSIVTFNYDRSIDYRLHQFVQAHFDIEDKEDAWKIVEQSFDIVHLHGSLGEYPQYEYGSTDDIYERSQDISIISEVKSEKREDGFVNDTFKKASELLNNADRVVILGFGFAKENVDRLRYLEEKDRDSAGVCILDGREIPKEQLAEDRDIIIAMGRQKTVPRKATIDWLKNWGLEDQIYFEYANELFQTQINPFIFE